PVRRFGVTADVLAAAPRGLGYARTTADRVTGDGAIVSAVEGRTASIRLDADAHEGGLPAKGIHYAVDAAAALEAARAVLGERFDADVAVRALSAIRPVFARGEIVEVRGQQIEFVLVQNPASFQLNVDALDEGLDHVLVAMGSDV